MLKFRDVYYLSLLSQHGGIVSLTCESLSIANIVVWWLSLKAVLNNLLSI